ncbi:MAG: molybdopterin oxidoreductase family protein [Betaproteobacteria bacterium]|nr:molybdopterin oxidoreductase family protein [Betaproteobacteria bacterium]MDH4323109.1 molybdopterin oxidoreductase family protein [Betaproteobacteria bacterium]
MSPMLVRAACPHDCPDTCGMLVTVEDGVAVKIQGDPSMPFTQGTLCTKVAHYLERTYAPERLLHPLKRVGPKGSGRFERISWDVALDEIAARLKALAAEDAQTILPLSYAGTMGMVQYSSMDRRFFHRLGASILDRTLCSSAGKAGIKATLGGSVGMDPERFDEAQLILLWGANPVVSNLHLWSRVQEAKRRGARVVAIDPYRSLSAEKCTQHVALLPGTDGALALAMMHVLIAGDLLDRDYIARHTLGFDALAERARRYTPQWAAGVCGLAEDVIVELARAYGTTKPAAIRLNYGMQRHAGGGIAARTIACLPALTGAWRDVAGGIVLTTADFYGFDHAALERPDLLAGRKPRVVNHAAIGDALTTAVPPVKAVIVYNNNPVAVCPESDKVLAGFRREDLYCVVMDSFMTDTADYADLVLPATTQLEHYDVHKSYGHLYAVANNPAIATVGESLPNSEVFRRLAARMGFDEPCFRDSDEDICRTALASSQPRMRGIDWDEMKKSGWQRLDVPARFAPFAEGGFPTPSGKCEFYSAALEQQGLDPLPFYNPPAEGAAAGELQFISPPARNFLNSSFAHLKRFRDLEGEPRLEMHAADAAARGIRDGDTVRVFNARGSLRLRAHVNDRPRPGVVVAPSVWWKKHSPDRGNANNLTAQRVADLGGGATFYDCRVQVERVAA